MRGSGVRGFAPARLTRAAVPREQTSLAERIGLTARRTGYHPRVPIPLTIAQARERDQRQRSFAASMDEPPIFTAEFVKTRSADEIAKLLDACFYDLVRTERRLLLDPEYDTERAKLRR